MDRLQQQMKEEQSKNASILENILKQLACSETKIREEVDQVRVQRANDLLINLTIQSPSSLPNDCQFPKRNDFMPLRTNLRTTPLSSAIIIPTTSSIPVFSGKQSERPKQFLVRVQEYAKIVHRWDRSMLLYGISQFLRDIALYWYCQLKYSH
jgi:hypothetical protein